MPRKPFPDCIILAGGQGSRLGALTRTVPKPALKLSGVPFIALLFDQILRAGGQRVIVSTGFQADKMAATAREVGGQMRRVMEVVCVEEKKPLGTGGAIRLAAVQAATSSLVVLNGDSFLDVDLLDVTSTHTRRRAEFTMVACEVSDAGAYGSVRVDAKDRLQGFTEKGVLGPGLVNGGVYVARRELIATIPARRAVSLERELFPRWTERRMIAHRTTAPLFDIGTAQRIKAARDALSDRLSRLRAEIYNHRERVSRNLQATGAAFDAGNSFGTGIYNPRE